MTIRERIENNFDPTDANAAQELASAGWQVLQWGVANLNYHGYWTNKHNRKEEDVRLKMALEEIAKAFNILPSQPSSLELENFWVELIQEIGIRF